MSQKSQRMSDNETYCQRFIRIKAELVTIEAEIRLEKEKPLYMINLSKLEDLTRLQSIYKLEISKTELKIHDLAKKSKNLKIVVFLYHFCYGWPLRKIASKYHFSLGYVKQISSQISQELKQEKI